VSAARPAVFIDRDGTMIHDVGYLSSAEQVQWYPWTIDAIRLLNRAGFLVCVTTNQGGIALGKFDEAFVRETHRALDEVLRAAGARVDAWLYCPHHPRGVVPALTGECACRKPRRGLIDQACAQFAIDLPRSVAVGDKQIDVRLGTGVGARGILVRTGYGENQLAEHGGTMPGAAFVADDLMSAVSFIVRS
jgi:D-glycero-D-manno-heptose 1,7-bisphosphate phosphatase